MESDSEEGSVSSDNDSNHVYDYTVHTFRGSAELLTSREHLNASREHLNTSHECLSMNDSLAMLAEGGGSEDLYTNIGQPVAYHVLTSEGRQKRTDVEYSEDT